MVSRIDLILKQIDSEIFINKPPVYLKKADSSDILFIAFTSEGSQGKSFDFYKFFNSHELNVFHQLFVSTCTGSWYGPFDKGIYKSEDSSLEILKQIIYILNVRKVLCIGSSKGGTGAIKYGSYLSELIDTYICAFCPKVFVGQHKTKGIRHYFNNEKKYLKKFDIFVDFNFPIDNIHIKDLKTIADIHNVSGAQHNVAKVLRKNGRLKQIIKSYFN